LSETVKTILLLPVLTLPALAEVPFQVAAETASIRFTSEGNGFVMEVNDPGNHAWMLQSTDNSSGWTNMATHRVFNGSLRIPVPRDGSRRLFRLNSDVAGQVSSSAANALILPGSPYNYANPTLPAHLLTPQIQGQNNTPVTNPTTNAGAALGRVLFYDKRLSANQTVSCSSCHQAEHGFSDPRKFSVGFDGGLTDRNSMGLTNARYYLRENFFWDERAATLEDQVLMPIQNEVEMGMTLDLLVQRIDAEPFYDELFTAAFGTPEVNVTRLGLVRPVHRFGEFEI
jgi:cytochrome c peroxidase